MKRFVCPLLAITLVLAPACDPASDSGSGTPPAAPRDFVVTALDGGAHLVWIDESDNEEEFVIERKDSGDWAEINAVVFDTTTYHDATILPNVEYTYRLMARNGDGQSAYTDEQTIMIVE